MFLKAGPTDLYWSAVYKLPVRSVPSLVESRSQCDVYTVHDIMLFGVLLLLFARLINSQVEVFCGFGRRTP